MSDLLKWSDSNCLLVHSTFVWHLVIERWIDYNIIYCSLFAYKLTYSFFKSLLTASHNQAMAYLLHCAPKLSQDTMGPNFTVLLGLCELILSIRINQWSWADIWTANIFLGFLSQPGELMPRPLLFPNRPIGQHNSLVPITSVTNVL